MTNPTPSHSQANCHGAQQIEVATQPLVDENFCGVAAAATLLGDTWMLLLIRDLADGPGRFTELQASTGISARVLTDRLRMMVAEGLVTRKMYAEIPPRVEYELTAKGREALPILDALRTYGEKWLRPELAVPPNAE